LLGGFPPTGLLLLAIISIQLGAALAINLFPILGAEGTVAIRIIISALLLGLAARGRVRRFASLFVRDWRLLLAYGLCISAMNFFFYKAISLIPLGAAVAIEFVGPLGIAALASHRIGHFACVGLAAFGILLLSPLTGVDLDTLGIVFALMAGAGWAGFGVALLSTTVPFTFEFTALKRLSNRAYGVIVSVEPVVAALIGALLLGERLGVQGMVAITCVVVAAIGITVTDGRDKKL
jgi:inner membrane transporter RhtA